MVSTIGPPFLRKPRAKPLRKKTSRRSVSTVASGMGFSCSRNNAEESSMLRCLLPPHDQTVRAACLRSQCAISQLIAMRGDYMGTCNQCGDEIVFRWVGGAICPTHVNGGWCTGGSGSQPTYARSSFDTATSYLDPNARCPVCNAAVYFYRSPHNGRVFFDDVGWPWPKHGCTDNYQGRDNQIMRPVTSRFRFNFKNREGKSLNVYTVEQVVSRANDVLIRLKNTERRTGRGSQMRVVILISNAN